MSLSDVNMCVPKVSWDSSYAIGRALPTYQSEKCRTAQSTCFTSAEVRLVSTTYDGAERLRRQILLHKSQCLKDPILISPRTKGSKTL